MRKLRSQQWFGTHGKDGFIHRSWMKNQGIPHDNFDGRPVIGICNTWSELTPCNAHFRELADGFIAIIAQLAAEGSLDGAELIDGRRQAALLTEDVQMVAKFSRYTRVDFDHIVRGGVHSQGVAFEGAVREVFASLQLIEALQVGDGFAD